MKRLIIWLLVLLICQTAFAIIEHRLYVSAEQNYQVGNFRQAKLNLVNMEPDYHKAPQYALLMGKICLALGEYKESYEWLEKFRKGYLGTDPLIDEELIELIHDAARLQKYTDLSMAVGSPKGRLNSFDSEYAPVLNSEGNTMYLSSLKRSPFGKENIFISRWRDGAWLEPVEVPELCTDFNECVGSSSEDGMHLYLFGYYNGTKTNGDIFISTLNKGKWSKPQVISEVSSKYYDLQPYVYDGKLMFFASNRHGNNDNYDIYVSENKNGGWSAPINLGPVINTKSDEQAPFFDYDGKTLYFSSRGHKGFGKDDIFKAEKIGPEWTDWSKPVNLGPIINSVGDDRYFFKTKDSSIAYYSSNRKNGIGLEDIYYIDLGYLNKMIEEIEKEKQQKPTDEPINLIVKGIVVDEEDNPLTAKVTLDYRQKEQPQTQVVSSDGEGRFEVPLTCTLDKLGYMSKPKGYEKAEGTVDLSKIETIGDEVPVVFIKLTCRKLGKDDPFDIRISGRVINEQNKPVATDVYWYYVDNDELNEVIVESNDDGAFTFYVPKISQLKYIVKDLRFAPKEEMLAIPAGINAYDLIIKVISVSNDIRISGKVTDKNDEPIVADIYWFFNKNDQTVEYHVTSKPDGTYSVAVQRNDKINYRVEKKNYMQVTGSMDIPLAKREFTKDFMLYKLDIAESFRLDNVLFDFNKATLKPVSYDVLDPVAATMKANPTLNIELSGHTDNVGGKDYNQKLSEARAKAVADYLISKDIDKNRITYKGYGMERPVADNKTDAGRAQNRRTELKVLGIEFEEDETEKLVAGFERAGTLPKVSKTIKAERASVKAAEGPVSAAQESEFKRLMIAKAEGQKGQLKVDMFVARGIIQTVKFYVVSGNFSDKYLDGMANTFAGWKLDTDKSFVHTLEVKIQ